MMDPAWLADARAHVGLREVYGAPTEPTIQKWLTTLGAWWRDDETPWCGTFVAGILKPHGFDLPKHWYRAKGWLDWGMKLEQPELGCIVVFERQGGGHVGFVTGRDRLGNLVVLGGNQGDAVNERSFSKDRVLGYRWPIGARFWAAGLPPVEAGLSTREA